MKVLVTGATGGLGELVIQKLLALNIDVVATSRDAEKAKAAAFFKKVSYKPLTIGEHAELNLFEYFEKPDLLIHLAWDKLNEYKNVLHLTQILENHKDFLQNLIQNGLRDLSVAGTVYEYGLQEGELNENMPSAATMPYPQAKNKLREFLSEMKLNYSFSFKWIRVFYVFGAIKERKNLYTMLLNACENDEKEINMSGGEQIRDFLSPEEIAQILVSVSLQKRVDGIINCCSGHPIKLKDKVIAFLKSKNYAPKINFGFYPYPDYEPMNTWGSRTKLDKALNAK